MIGSLNIMLFETKRKCSQSISRLLYYFTLKLFIFVQWRLAQTKAFYLWRRLVIVCVKYEGTLCKSNKMWLWALGTGFFWHGEYTPPYKKGTKESDNMEILHCMDQTQKY